MISDIDAVPTVDVERIVLRPAEHQALLILRDQQIATVIEEQRVAQVASDAALAAVTRDVTAGKVGGGSAGLTAASQAGVRNTVQAALDAEKKRYDDIEALRDYSGHINEDDEANTGAIAAVIVGAILLVVLAALLVYRCVVSKRAGEMGRSRGGSKDGKVLVNQSSFRSDLPTPKHEGGRADDI